MCTTPPTSAEARRPRGWGEKFAADSLALPAHFRGKARAGTLVHRAERGRCESSPECQRWPERSEPGCRNQECSCCLRCQLQETSSRHQIHGFGGRNARRSHSWPDLSLTWTHPRIHPKLRRLTRKYRCLGGIPYAVKSLKVNVRCRLTRKMSLVRIQSRLPFPVGSDPEQ